MLSLELVLLHNQRNGTESFQVRGAEKHQETQKIHSSDSCNVISISITKNTHYL